MDTITSKDGTTLAFDQFGEGPTVIFVNGALQFRAFSQGMHELAELLAPHFTVINYDRRGRGDSGDTLPFALEREIEDIEAFIDRAGGSAYLYGISSGAALAMEAAATLGSKVSKLALYEAPYNDDAEARQAWANYRQQIDADIAAGNPGDAVGHFMMLVGMPAEAMDGVKQDPSWPVFESIGHTLAYDAAALGAEAAVPTERAAQVTVPALVMDGSASYPFMRESAIAIAEAMPQGQHRTLEGQTHEVSSEVLAPVLVEFFRS